MKPDFLIIPYQVYINKNLTAVDGYLYGIIYWLERLKNGRCTASNKLLSEIMDIEPGSIQNSLSRLEKNGCIQRVFKDKQKKIRTEIMCLVAYERVSLNDDTVPLNDDTYVSSTDDHISNNTNSNNNNIDFSKFWDSYPKKVEKKKSEAKWNRLPIKTQRIIMADIPKRKQTKGWIGGFIPNPTTYLNGERWNDELKMETSAAPTETLYKPVPVVPERTPEEQARVRAKLDKIRATLPQKIKT